MASWNILEENTTIKATLRKIQTLAQESHRRHPGIEALISLEVLYRRLDPQPSQDHSSFLLKAFCARKTKLNNPCTEGIKFGAKQKVRMYKLQYQNLREGGNPPIHAKDPIPELDIQR